MTAAILEAPPLLRDGFASEAIGVDAEIPKGYEFVDGELRELNVSNYAALVSGEIFGVLRDYVKPRKFGWLYTEAASYRCFADRPRKVRRADATFHLRERLTPAQAVAKGPFAIAPDLVVEVISPTDYNYEVNAKRLEWLRAGAQQVWIVYPVEREIYVYRPEGTVVLRAEDTLTAEPLLPGFSVVVGDLFPHPEEG